METKFAVDRIYEDIVVLENLDTCQLEYVSKASLSFDVHEKDIVILKDGIYYLDDLEKEKRIEIITAKFNRVRRPN